MYNEKIIYKNIKYFSNNLKLRGYFLNKNFFKILFKKKLLILKKINELNNKKKYFNKKFKILKIKNIFLNKFLKIYKNFLKKINIKLKKIIINIPNLLNKKIPKFNNILIKSWKNKSLRKNFLLKNLCIDFELGNIISGFGFCIIKNPISYLYKALMRFMIDIHVKEHNYNEIIVPNIIKENSAILSSQLPKFLKKMFKIEKKKQYLISTSEIPIINTIKNSKIESKLIPIKITSKSPCFRDEKKCYGKENKGLLRQKQFDKIELIRFCDQKNSYNNLNELIKNSEKILRKLKLPYRIILLSTKNTGISSSKTYDIETWIPSLKNYCEVSSCSNTENYQSIRTNNKYKHKNILKNTHIINGSGLAVGRVIVSIIENFQKKNFINIPKILRKYINNKKFIKL